VDGSAAGERAAAPSTSDKEDSRDDRKRKKRHKDKRAAKDKRGKRSKRSKHRRDDDGGSSGGSSGSSGDERADLGVAGVFIVDPYGEPEIARLVAKHVHVCTPLVLRVGCAWIRD
jgi:hypothetical protein